MNRRGFVRSSIAAAVALSLPHARGFANVLSPSGRVDRDLDAVTGAGRSVTLPRAAVQELGDSLRGDLLLRGHDAYDDARRVLNGSIQRYPALIVQPLGSADVKNAIDFARANELLVAVKCGGHSPSGKSTCNDGLMIDMSRYRNVRVDPQARIAHVSGGSLLGDMDHDTMAFGLATTAGTVSHTGVAGLTLGGGFGRVARRFGLALDNVRSLDIVTADGVLRHVSPDENPELYWGLRGGGGNFGVVTNFEFGLHPMNRLVIGGNIGFPLSEARQVLEFYSEYGLEAPDELYLDGVLLSIPAQDTSVVAFNICWSGDHAAAEPILDLIRSVGTVILDDVRPMDYTALQKSGDISDARAIGSYTKTGFASAISPGMIDAIVTGLVEDPGRSTTIGFQHGGGAIGRVAPDATAFPHRDVNFTGLLLVDWPVNDDPTQHIDWLQAYWDTIEPHTKGFYTNDVVDETQAEVDANYLGNFGRLLALKNRYDPTNLLRLNANIVPTV